MLYTASRVPYVMNSKKGLSGCQLGSTYGKITRFTIVEAYACAQPSAVMIHYL